jgi:hypothetical protein
MRLIFSIDLILPAVIWPGVDSASNRMSTNNLPGGKKWPARRADVAVIYEPNV